jgi:general L-amino acid transport system permease protein
MNRVLQHSSKWLRTNMFSNFLNSITSVIILFFIGKLGIEIFNWLIVNSVWNGTPSVCRQSDGACLAFIREKFLYILFGFYPREILYRPILGLLLILACVIYSSFKSNWSKKLLYIWCAAILTWLFLMRGGVVGLQYVDIDRWGGLPLTIFLSVVGIIFSYPIGIVLALLRRSELFFLRYLSIIYIELIRGVPLISLLFMASVMFPLFLPEGIVIEKLFRAQVAIIMFISAYVAEVVRGGLQSIDKGQYEGAKSLGLNYFQTLRFIILPQALKVVVPPTVNTFIGMFKDTSLVIIISLFDLMYTTKTSLTDSDWLGFSIEAYFFVAIIYFVICFSMAKYSKKLEGNFHRS